MRSIEDKGCLTQEAAAGGASCMSFEFKSNGLTLTRSASHHHRTSLGKPTPSKWDDAQKWLVNLSRGEKNPTKASPRNSNADDRRLIALPFPRRTTRVRMRRTRRGRMPRVALISLMSICVRDMGTEMTPMASQEPSRTATPIRATTPAARSPVSSGTSTPARGQNGAMTVENGQPVASPLTGEEKALMAWTCWKIKRMISLVRRILWKPEQWLGMRPSVPNTWQEVKIQAWENHQKRKAEMQMRKVEVKAERLIM
ncbi:hypothetical protein SASPL_148395 [Salvia splendens]|uniref:Uncharacterized protein n=1 Tax=Salvia splendens TaxID=180675 RepID=A0A8X8Z3C3_SALSN|nr:hypothetical protein SASPL_148395 [Salvia splendens]